MMTAKQIKEQEAEDAIRRQSVACAMDEVERHLAADLGAAGRRFVLRGATTGRFPASAPNLSQVR